MLDSEDIQVNKSSIEEYLNKLKKSIKNSEILKEVYYYLILGKFKLKLNPNNSETILDYFNALNILQENFQTNHPLYLRVYADIIEYYFQKKNYLLTLDYVQKALENLSEGFKSKNYYENPDPDSFRDYDPVFFHLRYKTLSLLNLYKHDRDINFLFYARENAEYILSLMERLKWKYDHENHKYYISETETEIFKIAEKINYELFSQTGEEKYMNRAFELNERAKAFSLLINLRSEQAMEYGGIPPELIRNESDIIQKISAFTELVLEEKNRDNPDKNKIRNWENSLFRLNNEHDQLIRFFENNYPEYYRLKYDTRVISSTEVKNNLSKEDAIIEYSLSDSLLYTYVITNQNISVLEQKVDPSFRKLCLDYYQTITSQSFSYGVRKTFADYSEQSYQLYKILIQPVEDLIEGRNIILIPDGEISYVSFDALLKEPVDAGLMNYYRLPFLIYDHGFSNSFSATLHFTDPVKKPNPRKNILAFAPSYSNISVQNVYSGFELLRQNDFEKLIRIPGVKEEVKRISSFMDADVYQDFAATESNFRENAADYKVLHLAMHTILDDKNPLYSKLAFAQLIDSLNDGFLHTYEIYNMQLNAELAVLSSCNSGFGSLQEGEGIQSLARGFAYAGCPSILMTLWEVADNSTVELMEKFYYYLNMGYSKSESLHLSKIDFLSSADQLKSNPFFWSSFVLVGDSSPIYTKKSLISLMNLGILLIPLLVLLYFFRVYNSGKKKEMAS